MKQRKDGRWCKKVKLPDGTPKYFYSTESTEKKAEKDIDNQILQYNIDCNYKKHNFKEIAEQMLEEQACMVSYSTVECYKYSVNHMQCFFPLNIEDVTPIIAQNLLNDMGKKRYSKSAMSKVKTTLGLIFKRAILNGCNVTNFSTCLKVPKTSKTKVMSPSDEVISIITKSANTVPFGLWTLTLLCTGLRPGELNGLQVRNIDFTLGKRVIKITQAVEFIGNQPVVKPVPKTDDGDRMLPILDLLYEPLKNHCKNLNESDFVFSGDKPFTKTQMRKRWDKYKKSVGRNFTQYQLRHAYALILYRAGIDPKTMQYLLGHADFSTTMNIYTQFSKEKNLNAAESVNEFLNKTYT